MSMPEQAAKVAHSAVDAMKSTPLAIALLIVNVGFLGFAAYVLGEVAANASERNKTQSELITKLVTDIRDCRQGPKPTSARSLVFKDNRIVISSGHGKYVRGAAGNPGLDEVDEARRVVERVADKLEMKGVDVTVYHDNVSKTQQDNLNAIVAAHNKSTRELDVSIHFNAFDTHAHGVEVCYLTQPELAAQLSSAIASCGFTDRGGKHRTDLKFLNSTDMPSVLIETCFCDCPADCAVYEDRFDDICEAIASVLGGDDDSITDEEQGEEDLEHPPAPGIVQTGTCSSFGGPDDSGVSPSEGLAFIYDITPENQWLFLPIAPANCTGLARRLNVRTHYCAMRWDYSLHPKETLLQKVALVRNPRTGFALTCTPADWGPHEEKTGRLIDLSPAMMMDLDLETDDEVEVIFPWTEEA